MKALPIAALVALTGCSAVKGPAAPPALTLMQAAQTFRLPGGAAELQQVAMKNRLFEITAENVPADVAIQVCAKPDDEVVKALAVGSNFTQHPCFKSGTGMAMKRISNPKLGLPLIVTSRNAHNYYSNDRRLNSGKTATIFLNEFEFLDTAPADTVWLAVVIDRNKDKVLQAGEFWQVQVQLKAME